MKQLKLSFAKGNAKLGKSTAVFSLPAGFTCPGALNCLSRAHRVTGKVKDGPSTQFRCYAATSEAMLPNVRKSRWNNFELLKKEEFTIGMSNLILKSLPLKAKLIRVHASGDFFSQDYFNAWLRVAILCPSRTFYCYTKALPYWIACMGWIPPNFHLVASHGGRYDNLITQYKLRSVRVVFTEDEAKERKLKIDHDDSLVWNYNKDFAILLHGTQPAGTNASRAWQKIKTVGRGGYSKGDYFKHYGSNKAKNAYKKKIN